VDVLCYGNTTGSIDLTVTGGTGPYTYLWNTSPVQTTEDINGLGAGTYTVTVSDQNNCTTTASVTITEPSQALSASTTQVDVLCYGNTTGSIDLTVTGGTGSYTYLWNTTPAQTTEDINGLGAGIYTVTVTDQNNCTTAASVTITEPASGMSASTTQVNVLCNGNTTGSIDLTVIGGTGPYTYLWNTSPVQTTEDINGLGAGTYTVTVTDQNNCTTTASVTITEPSQALSASTTQVNVLCNGNTTGSIDLTVIGGTGPYTYLWNTSPVQTTEDINGLGAGTYTVTVTDQNNCTTTASVTITEPSQALSASTTQVDVLCYGNTTGSIDLTVTGGTGSYTYLWNTTPAQTTEDINGLGAGIYTVTVTDQNNCTTAASVTITEPASGMSESTTQVNVLCNGNTTGSIDLTVTGGTGSYTYSWNTTPVQTTEDINNLSAGTYTVTITDQSNCTITTSVTITEPSQALSASTTQVNVLCNGNTTGSIDLTEIGGTGPYTYLWNTSPVQTTEDINGLGAGTYTVTVTDQNNCTTTASVTITEPAVLSATLASQTNVSCFGGSNGSVSIIPSGGVGSYSISPSQIGLSAGTYNFTVTDNNGCQTTVNATITEPQADLNASISNQINISCNGLTDGSVSLNITGGSGPYTTVPSTSNLASGNYTFVVTDNNGCTASTSTTITQPTSLVAQGTSTTITTSGGSSTVTISASGGTAPYSGTGTFTVVAGTYSYTVTDFNGCTDVVTLTITEPLPLTVSSTYTNIQCNGGTAQVTITPSGGTSPYSGAGTFTVTAGTYTYTITDFYGNTASTTITVTEPNLLTASSSALPILCNGNSTSVTVSAAGGTTPYSGIGIFNEIAGNYNYIVTDNNGCNAQTNISINQPTPIVLSTTVIDIVCVNNFGSIDLSISGGVGPYDVIWENSILSEDLSNLNAGNYSVEVTDGNGCIVTMSETVYQTLASIPVLTNTTGTTVLTCSTTNINYSISGVASVLWSGGSTPNSSSNSFNSPGQYIVNVTDINSCPLQYNINLTQDITPPTAGITNTLGSTVLTCSNPSINIQATGGVSYQWSNGLGTSANQAISQAGTYTVTVTGSNGCTSTQSITFTSNIVLPTAVITNNTGSIILHCNQNQINVTASGGVSYAWSNSLGSNPTVNLINAGTYTVTVTAANGCTDTESITINQIPNPTVSVSPITICSGSTGNITAVPSTPGGTFVWTQLPSNIVLPFSTATASVSPTSNAIYNVQYFDVNNCPSNIVMANVTVTPTPVLNISGTTTICSGNNAVLTANSSLTGAGGTYTWSPNTASTQSVTVTPLISTTYSVYYTLNGCPSNTANHLVTVYQTPTVSVNNVGICTGAQATLTATPSSVGGNYSWNTTPNVSTTQSITVQPLGTTTYTVVYTSTNNCPSLPASGTVTVTDIPTVQLDDIYVCEGQSGTLTAVPSTPGGTFSWTPSIGSNGNSYSFSPDASTSVSVIYSLNGCPSPIETALVTLVNTPSVTVSDITICQNETGTLTAIPSSPGGTFLWSTTDQSVSINVNPQETTTYSVMYILFGCPSPLTTANVYVEPIPVITFDVDIIEGCSPLTINFTNTTLNANNCFWNLGNGAIFNECDELSYTFQNEGVFDVSLTTDSPNGCSNTLTLNDLINVFGSPNADFSVASNFIDVSDPTVSVFNNSIGAVDYIWNFGDNTILNSEFNPEPHTYEGLLENQYYVTLTAISENGCIDTSFQLIQLTEDVIIYAPNTFTPDDDDLNENWKPVITSGIERDSYELNIFNRWGELFFTTKDYDQGWDGTFRGNEVQNGTYSYQLIYSKTGQTKKNIILGHINLIR
jgi:gliding motility-associated-like protein